MHQQLPLRAQHRRAVVAATRRRAGEQQHEVRRIPQRRQQRLANIPRLVGHAGQHPGLAARRAYLGRQHQTVGFDDLARRGRDAWRHQLAAGRQDVHARPASQQHAVMAAAGQRPQIHRPQHVVGRQHQFAGDHILAQRPHVLPGRDRAANCDAFAVQFLRMLDHDDAVRAWRQRVAGVDWLRLFRQPQRERARLGRAARPCRCHRVAVHGRRVIVRRGQARVHALCRHPAQGLRQRHLLAWQRPVASAREQGLGQTRPRLRQRNILKIDVALVHAGSIARQTCLLPEGCCALAVLASPHPKSLVPSLTTGKWEKGVEVEGGYLPGARVGGEGHVTRLRSCQGKLP